MIYDAQNLSILGLHYAIVVVIVLDRDREHHPLGPVHTGRVSRFAANLLASPLMLLAIVCNAV